MQLDRGAGRFGGNVLGVEGQRLGAGEVQQDVFAACLQYRGVQRGVAAAAAEPLPAIHKTGGERGQDADHHDVGGLLLGPLVGTVQLHPQAVLELLQAELSHGHGGMVHLDIEGTDFGLEGRVGNPPKDSLVAQGRREVTVGQVQLKFQSNAGRVRKLCRGQEMGKMIKVLQQALPVCRPLRPAEGPACDFSTHGRYFFFRPS